MNAPQGCRTRDSIFLFFMPILYVTIEYKNVDKGVRKPRHSSVLTLVRLHGILNRTVRPPAAYVFSDWSERRQWWNRGGRRRTSSTLAIPSRATLGFVQLRVHRVGGLERRIQANRSGRGRAKMGRKKEQTEHELR